MKLTNYIHINNKRIKLARNICLILCLILGLVSSMILSFYISTESLFQFNLGYTLLRLSTIFFTDTIACSIAFDKFIKK